MPVPLPALALLAALGLGCGGNRFDVDLHVEDERGQPIAGATVRTPDDSVSTDAEGDARLEGLTGPVMALVEADGTLAEPLPLGRWDAQDAPVSVQLLDAEGRIAVHSTGDMMLGRRYVAPTEGSPLLDPDDGGSSARAIVDDVADVLGAADLVTANLETVVGELPDDQAYPGKRWLLQTPPVALAALDALGVDVAGLANNHQRDWLDAGVASTLDELDAAGQAWVGAGMDAEEAAEGIVVDVQGQQVGILAFTSVDGDYVNDQYPGTEEEVPLELEEEQAFAWEQRSWGIEELGIATEDRRIGEVWALIAALEDELADDEQALLWASASAVYPELQDWVARRGHAGANPWSDQAPDRIAALAADSDLLIVQLHMGYQFATAPSEYLRLVARQCIEAGADIVVAHHPHVLQGVEWIDGHLVVWSLGNFAFDQDFLSTFSSAFLRTVWEGDALVQARLVPVFLDRYRPVPVADGLARRALRRAWELSVTSATAMRGSDLGIRAVPEPEPGTPPSFHLEHGTARIGQEPVQAETLSLKLPADGLVALPTDRLIRLDLSDDRPSGVEVGRGLGGLGSFEDDDGDRDQGEAAGWTWSSEDIRLVDRGALAGQQSLSLLRSTYSVDRVSARMIARIAMPAHHLYADAEGAQALDGDARYAVRLLAERKGPQARASVRVVLYHFDDLNPTESPESILLREVELDLDATRSSTEHLLELPADALEPVDGLLPNAALLYVSLYPPDDGLTELIVDEVELTGWRPAEEQPTGWGAIDWLRDVSGSKQTLEIETRAW